jgi:hypothetical protein
MDNDEQIYVPETGTPTPEPPPTQVFLQMVDSGSLLSWMTERSQHQQMSNIEHSQNGSFHIILLGAGAEESAGAGWSLPT